MSLPETRNAELETATATALRELVVFGGLMDGTHSKEEIRQGMIALAKTFEPLPQVEPEMKHIFADGLYGRQWSCPAGNAIVTEIHKVQHISSLIKGRIIIASTDGVQDLEAPQFFVTQPGTQRVILTLTDAVFTTVHLNPDNEKDPDVIKNRVTCRDYNEVNWLECAV